MPISVDCWRSVTVPENGRAATYYGVHPERTPRLVVNPLLMASQVARFRDSLPSAEIYFPVKCCPMPVALLTLGAAGCRFEYASVAEIDKVDRLGLDIAPGIFGAPARRADDSALALRRGVQTLVIDSIDEARKLAGLSSECQVLIRLEVESADTTMPLSTKFGVTAAGNRELLWACADLGLDVAGYVFHVGSQTRSTNPWARAIEAVAYASA